MRFKVRSIKLLLIALGGLMLASPGWAVEVVDDEGNLLQLQQPAQRIISLAPSLTELIFAAGAGAQLVGVVEFSDYPEAATRLPIVGRHDLLDLEAILQLDADLVVAWQSGNPRASVNRLRQLGLAVYVAEPKSLESIATHLRRLGTLAGTEAVANAAAAEYSGGLQQLERSYANQAPVDTFYQVWDTPLITAGGNELINDIISLCGGRNVFAEINLIAPKVSREAVLVANPEVIVASGMDRERPEWLDAWRAWPSLPAVSENNLYFVPPALLQRHTPRALRGAEQLCAHLDKARQKR